MFSTTDLHESFHPSLHMREAMKEGEFKPSFNFDEKIKNVRFDIDRVKIKKKKELIGKAEIYLAWVVTDDQSGDPIKMDKTEIFRNVKKGDELPLGPGGLTIYRNDPGKLPHYLDYRILVLESDEDTRALGETFEEIRKMDEYKKTRDAILKASSLGAPQVDLITAASDFVLKMVGKILGMNKDDQMILIEGSYDRVFDDLGTIYGTVTKRSRYVNVDYAVQTA